MVRRKQGKKAEQQKRKTAELAAKRVQAKANTRDVESGLCCADCLCAH
jgi:hypothetical protein